jgi:hypothetical protein
VDISYRAGTRHPESALIHLTGQTGGPLTLEVETLISVPLHVGGGIPATRTGRTAGGWAGVEQVRGLRPDRTGCRWPDVVAR